MTMFSQDQVNQWFAANPTATPEQVAQTVQGLGGLDANQGLAGLIGQHYGTDANTITSNYNTLTAPAAPVVAAPTPVATTPDPYAAITNAYQAGDYTGVNSLLSQGQYTPAQIQQHYGLTTDQLGDIRNKGVNLGYTTPEIQSLVSNTLADKTLQPWEQANKILESGQKYGFDQSTLGNLYGAEAVSPYMDAYKTQINKFLTDTLAKDTGTTMKEVGEIHRAAQKYGVDVKDLVNFGGVDAKTAQSYFDTYNQGLGNIVAGLNDPKVDNISKTQTALALQQTYGTTDAELAKASNGKYTEKDIAAYLDPVRNVPANLNKLFADPNATAADVKKFIAEAKADPRAAGIYGAALDKVLSNPELYWRDAANGKADVSDSYESFLSVAKSTPEMATKYAPQIEAIERAKTIIGKHALNKDFGGEYKDFAMEMFMGLDKNTAGQAPKKLEFTAPKTETRTGGGDEGGTYTYEAVVPGTVKNAGVKPITDEDGNVTGYTKLLDAKAFDETWPGQKERFGVRANYDADGKLTGYESGARVHVSDPQYYQAKWDANGNPKPFTGANSGGGVRGFVKDVMSDPIMGSIANIAASYFGGPLGVATLAAVQGVPPEEIAKRAAISYVGNQVGGEVSSATGGAGGALGEFGSQAAGQFAGNAASGILSGQGVDFNNLLLNSLVNTGINTGTNSLLGESGMDKLGAMQPYATGIASNLVSSAISGQNPDLLKTVSNTAMKEAMKSGKAAAKTATVP